MYTAEFIVKSIIRIKSVDIVDGNDLFVILAH